MAVAGGMVAAETGCGRHSGRGYPGQAAETSEPLCPLWRWPSWGLSSKGSSGGSGLLGDSGKGEQVHLDGYGWGPWHRLKWTLGTALGGEQEEWSSGQTRRGFWA